MPPIQEVFTDVARIGAPDLALGTTLLRMAAAAAIGALLASQPWRHLTGKPLPTAENFQAQVLLCTAAAVVTAVIGDSMAKAFGLVGLGGFVRFRAGVRDRRDAAVLFLVIGLGMACGHGSLVLAGVGTAFVFLLQLLLDLTSPREVEKKETQRLLLSAEADDLHSAELRLRQALGARNVVVHGCAMDFASRRLELEVEERELGALGQALSSVREPGSGQLRGLRWGAVERVNRAEKERT